MSMSQIDFTPPAGRKYLFTEDLVRMTGIPNTTWQKWRSLKKGPPYRKLGRRAAYLPEDLAKWDESQKILTE
ncbi:helix-turn-helix domain-containing protein [Desulfovibrio sp. OttesenSCG-928-A18]|nr:helix-turn-helix domain-containing protein [Desulfovibrio sp. OttesenSCG-928-A18]